MNYNFERQVSIIDSENVNVTSKNEIVDFLILVAKITAVILIIIWGFGVFSDCYVSHMSKEKQRSIEKLLVGVNKDKKLTKDENYLKKASRLEPIKQKIVAQDESLEGLSELPIYVMEKKKEANAFVDGGGNIYVTTKMLDFDWSDEEWTFILAHEIGHYSHKDHLKAISKRIVVSVLVGASAGNESVGKLVNGISNIDFLSHSRKQEKEADWYANRMLYRIYGNNSGATSAIMKLKAKEKVPEFVYYFSTHPSWNERLKNIENKPRH